VGGGVGGLCGGGVWWVVGGGWGGLGLGGWWPVVGGRSGLVRGAGAVGLAGFGRHLWGLWGCWVVCGRASSVRLVGFVCGFGVWWGWGFGGLDSLGLVLRGLVCGVTVWVLGGSRVGGGGVGGVIVVAVGWPAVGGGWRVLGCLGALWGGRLSWVGGIARVWGWSGLVWVICGSAWWGVGLGWLRGCRQSFACGVCVGGGDVLSGSWGRGLFHFGSG